MEDNVTVMIDEPNQSGFKYELTPRRKFMLSLDVIFFIVGFLGNCSVIYMTLRHKGLRSIPNLMIANLAVGDILVVILVIFTNILFYLMESARLFLRDYCDFILFVQFLSQGVSVLTLTALSVDRCTIVMFPIRKQHNARKITVMTVVGIWAISFVIVCPMFSLLEDATCWFSDAVSNTVYILFLVIFLYFIPAIVMVVCYCMTAHKLLQRNATLNLDPQGGKRQQRKRSRLAIIVLTMTIVFILSSSLLYMWVIVFRFAPTNQFVRNVHVNRAKAVLLKFNSIVNPIILYLMSSTYRHHLAYNLRFCLAPFKKSKKPYYTIHPSVNSTSISRKTSIYSTNSISSRRASFMREVSWPFSNALQRNTLRKQRSCPFACAEPPKTSLVKEISWPVSSSFKRQNMKLNPDTINIPPKWRKEEISCFKDTQPPFAAPAGKTSTPVIQEESHL